MLGLIPSDVKIGRGFHTGHLKGNTLCYLQENVKLNTFLDMCPDVIISRSLTEPSVQARKEGKC